MTYCYNNLLLTLRRSPIESALKDDKSGRHAQRNVKSWLIRYVHSKQTDKSHNWRLTSHTQAHYTKFRFVCSKRLYLPRTHAVQLYPLIKVFISKISRYLWLSVSLFIVVLFDGNPCTNNKNSILVPFPKRFSKVLKKVLAFKATFPGKTPIKAV